LAHHQFFAFRHVLMPLLLLVDGSSYLYRAFHAMPDLRNKAGEPTGAIYGVLNMLRRLESDYKADYKAVRLRCQGQDLPRRLVSRIQGPPAADAGRSGQADRTHPRRDQGRRLAAADGRRRRGRRRDRHAGDGRPRSRGIDTLISTGDKDLTQLVGPHVRWYNTMSNELLDEAGVWPSSACRRKRIVDYLALVGDTVDNVPGVPEVRPEDGRQMAGAIRFARNRRPCRRNRRRGRPEPARPPRLPAARQEAGHRRCDLANLPAPSAN
jgi:DNA polymerase-1